jgi:hypothetical protein
MRNIRLKHKNEGKTVLDTCHDETGKWELTEEEKKAFENIKSLGRKEMEEGRGDSPISKAIKLLIEEVEKASQV